MTTTTPRPAREPRVVEGAPSDPKHRPSRGGPTSPAGPPRGGWRGPRTARAGERRRMLFLTVALVVVLALFAGRLVYVQVVRGPSVAQEAREKRLTSYSLIGTRGQITDRDGVALATSVERYDVSVNQLLVGSYRGDGTEADPDGALGVAKRLAPLLDEDVAELGGRLVGERQFVYLLKGVLPEVAREIFALRLPGINVDKAAARTYPNGNLAGNVIGYTNSNGQGLAGLEASLDDQLKGTPGVETYERGAKGQAVPGGLSEGTPARTGDSVRLTLDADIQWKAQSLLDAQVAATKSDGGTVVVTNVRTGEILALADSGSTDPNNPGDAEEGSLAASVSNVFEPGSTGKVITMAAVIEEGLVGPTDRWTVPYVFTTDNGQQIHDSHEHGTLHLTTTGVLAESSNTGTVQVGAGLSEEKRYQWLTRFGFGSTTGVELPGESRGILHDWEDWDGRTKWNVLFGQGVAVTALQATQVFATIANDGVRVEPHVIAGWTDPDGEYTEADPAPRTRIVSQETADTVLSMMESVVDDGTGANASIPGYRVAGKTGTAQNWLHGKQGITASFIGVVPADDPQIAVSVFLHEPKTSIYGGTVAAPVFKEVAAYTLSELGVAPSGTKPTLFPTEW
ncbi:peptidoglycan D,D-transpeptidase FtsI family protein [Cellulomonas fulva]|uniref:peptidoglycan D,D-transpeptidase FtsI family protein n=1 Tax=Cellulomonas fulva TaxID=2835530 RepID=UPI0027DCE9C6|nr:penicillin-binding protein 2 [Cellulomonas fulva]